MEPDIRKIATNRILPMSAMTSRLPPNKAGSTNATKLKVAIAIIAHGDRAPSIPSVMRSASRPFLAPRIMLLAAYYSSGTALLALSSLTEWRQLPGGDERSLRFAGGLAEGIETFVA